MTFRASAMPADPRPERPSGLDVRLLGPLEVWRDGQRLPLPRSRKTRALLGYLVSSTRSHTRDHLSTLLWDATDDPRGALRWSLSKLRPVLDAGTPRINVERDRVAFAPGDARVDATELAEATARGLSDVTTADLQRLADEVRGEFLEGVDLPDLFDFQAWCIARREQAREARSAILAELVARLGPEPARALPYSRAWVEADTFSVVPRVRLLELLLADGKRDEARQQYELSRRLLLQANAPAVAELDAAWRSANRGATPAVRAPDAPVEPYLAAGASRQGPTSPQVGTLVGRRDELKRLETLLIQAVRERSQRVVTIIGEPGAGKTRLADEFVNRARTAGVVVLESRSFEAESSRAFGPWIDALGDEVAILLQAPPDQPGPATRDDLFGAVARAVTNRIAARGGALLVFDDVQWLDSDSTELLHYVARFTRNEPLVVLLLARTGELEDNEPVLRALRSVRRHVRVTKLELAPLSLAEVRELVQAYDGANGDEIFAASSGNPLFALELARAAERGEDGSASSVQWLIRERVEHLPPGSLEVLRWAAVLGHAVEVDRLQALTKLDVHDLMEALRRLEGQSLLRQDETAAGGRYAFAHDVVRQSIYGGLSQPRRRLMHREVVRLLEAQKLEAPTVTELAHHAGLAGEAMLGVRACIAAGTHALRIFANGEAEALALRGLGMAGALEGPERVAATLDLLHIQYSARTPNREQAAERVNELAVQALDLGLTAAARLGFQMVSFLRWESASMADAHANIEQAERVSRLAEPGERAAALAHAARCLVLLERNLNQAEAFLLEADLLSRRGEHSTSAAQFAAAMLHQHRGDFDQAAASFREARWQGREQGDHLAEFAAMEQWTMLEIDRRRYQEALTLATELAALGGRLREGAEAPTGRGLLALARRCLGLAIAGNDLDEALGDLRAADAKYRLVFLLTRLARVELESGDQAAARDHAAAGLDLAKAIGRPSDIAFASLVLWRCARVSGDSAEGVTLQALATLRSHDLSAGLRTDLEAILASARDGA